jgi:hypothetical protein
VFLKHPAAILTVGYRRRNGRDSRASSRLTMAPTGVVVQAR